MDLGNMEVGGDGQDSGWVQGHGCPLVAGFSLSPGRIQAIYIFIRQTNKCTYEQIPNHLSKVGAKSIYHTLSSIILYNSWSAKCFTYLMSKYFNAYCRLDVLVWDFLSTAEQN